MTASHFDGALFLYLPPRGNTGRAIKRMTEAKSDKQQQIKEILARIESGIQNLFQSDQYRLYLQTMAKFHRYSLNRKFLDYIGFCELFCVLLCSTDKMKSAIAIAALTNSRA